MTGKTTNQDDANGNPAEESSDTVQPGLDGLLGTEEATGPSVGSVGRDALQEGSADVDSDHE